MKVKKQKNEKDADVEYSRYREAWDRNLERKNKTVEQIDKDYEFLDRSLLTLISAAFVVVFTLFSSLPKNSDLLCLLPWTLGMWSGSVIAVLLNRLCSIRGQEKHLASIIKVMDLVNEKDRWEEEEKENKRAVAFNKWQFWRIIASSSLFVLGLILLIIFAAVNINTKTNTHETTTNTYTKTHTEAVSWR